MTVQDIIDKLDSRSPIDSALDWDNVGLLVGNATKEVKSIYIALDATDEVISHAIDTGADMILTHHPLIFSGMKRITADDFIGRRVMSLIRNDISYVAFHTNFDVFGMGDIAADTLGLRNAEPLDETEEDEGIGRIGDIGKVITLRELAETTKKAFDISYVNVYGDLSANVCRIAISPGSGKSEVDVAVSKGADVLITGDIGHHDGIDAVAKGIAVIDAGHYGIEHIFIDDMVEYLGELGLNIYKEEIRNPYEVV